MVGIQIFLIVCAAYIIAKVVGQYKGGALSKAALFFWVLFWTAVIIVAISPQTTTLLAGFFGVGRGADFVIYASLTFLFYAVFRLFLKIEYLERQITQLVRKIALDEHD